MSATLLKGKPIAKQLLLDAEDRIKALKAKGRRVTLAVLLVGDDGPSHTYVNEKERAAKKIGMHFLRIEMPATSKTKDVVSRLKKLQSEEELSGLIVQLPLPNHINANEILNTIDPTIDVDCLTEKNMGSLLRQTEKLTPPTPQAVLDAIESTGLKKLAGKHVTILGMGLLVGRPLAAMLMAKRASVTVCNSATKEVKNKCLAADIIVTGVGKKDVLRADMIAEGAIVIDTGVSYEDNVMFGDVNVQEASAKASYVTPTPGGIGPLTVARLLTNTILCAEKKYVSK